MRIKIGINDNDSYNNDDIHDAEDNNYKRLVVGMM